MIEARVSLLNHHARRTSNQAMATVDQAAMGASARRGDLVKARKRLALLTVVALAALAGVGAASSSGKSRKDKVTLQLKWVTQAQFAGYYAAKARGYYDQEGLDVNIKVGGPSITPEQVVLGKQAEFGIDWLPSLLAARDQGQDLVNIAQVFGKSGMTELTW